ncbi:hypothetical protein NC653_026422 [Populus alba x Populus x berolinensis]|uniref:Uncharacterized protein n=1 Tax=Populus alba x Populus x berolinensis TaxID=444605 RepID=A0AAD6MG01_9ROSI|nr:hypothetical protein NC653_026422 [Populus alba x Populus x berolinensis]
MEASLDIIGLKLNRPWPRKENLVSFSRASINCHWLAPNPVSLRSLINRSLKRRERSKAKYSKPRERILKE